MAFTRPRAAQIDFDVTNISDPLIRLNSGQTGSADKDVGIVIERGDDTNTAIIYDESANEFAVINTTETGSTSGNVTIASYADIRAGTFYGDGSGLTGVTSYTDSDVASYLSSNTIATSNINVSGDVLPDADNTRSLGSASLQWQEVYIGPGSLYVNGKKVLEESAGTIVVSADADQSLTVKTTGTGVLTLQSATTVNVAGTLQIQSGNSITDSAGTAVAFGDPLDMNSNKITELGTPSASTDAATKGYVDTTAAGYLPLTGGTISSNLTVSGNFTVNGTTTTINTSTLSVADNLIDLNSDVTSGTPSQDAGIRILRGDSNAVQLRWNETNDKWELTTDGSSYANIAVTSDIPTAVSDLTNDSGYITGYTVTQSDVTAHQAALSITESQISDLQSYLTAETNDLTAVVTWANVPDANITQSSVTQHQAALSITESQISDLGTYLTASDITGKLNLSGGTMSGAIAMGANAITGMADPSSAQDAATKAYVDSQVSSVPTGDITSVTASTGLTGGGTTGDVTLSIDSTVATLTGTQTLTNKTLTAPVISTISNTGTLTLPTSTGTVALTSDIPTAVSDLTNDSGYITGYTVTQSDVTTHQAALSITESQISDLSHTTSLAFAAITSTPTTLSGYGITDAVASSAISTFGGTLVDDADAATARTTLGLGTAATTASTDYATAAQGTKADTAHGWGNHASAGYLTSFTETNDLSAAVTWANVPNANITQGSVTQHQTALTITESQISDLQSYLTSETTTTLIADSVNQRLQYTDEDGTTNNIDLSWAVDDTNLARITSGSVAADTGIATFTRDDASTFTVDFSALFDDTNLTRITSAAFDTSTGLLTLTRSDATTVTVNLDSRYLTSYTVTESDVTTHQAALSITESQISDLGTYLTASDITGKLNLSGGTMSGAIAMGTNKITGMGDPTANQDAATKAYVDSQVSSVPTGDITAVNITAGTGLSGTVSTASGDHTQTLSIDSTVATLTGSQTLTNKTLTAPVISTISNTGTLTLPTSTGTVALTSDIPTAVSELTNDSGYSTTTGTVTSVGGTGTVNGLTLSGTVTSSGSLTLGGTLSITESQISDLGSYLTSVALNDVSDVTITTPSSGQVLKYNGSAWVNDTDSGGIALTDLSVTTASAGSAALAYNNSTGAFTFTPPDLSSYLTSYTVTQSDVTTHQAALSITESQISDLGTYLTASDITGKLNLSGGTMSGAIAMGTNKITGMGDPTAAQDAATKAYVDTQVSAGGGGNAFTTISVATQSDVAADSSTDTLTLAASGLIGITTDAATDTVTIATPSTVALPFLLADGSTSNIDFFTSGKINSVMTNLYIPFTKADGSDVTTMVVGGA
jgi:putative sterol carrier protein